MPFVEWPKETSVLDFGTSTSSLPTAALSSTLGNHLSIIMHNHPGTTLEDANTIMQERYLRSERFKYKDPDDGKIKDGEHWHFIDSDKFILEEILHESEVKSALQNIPQSLPSTGGLYYEGKGIQYTIDGQTYDMTEENRTALENAVISGKEITWTYNADQAKKYGVTSENSITVQVMDTKARLIPDISMTVRVR